MIAVNRGKQQTVCKGSKTIFNCLSPAPLSSIHSICLFGSLLIVLPLFCTAARFNHFVFLNFSNKRIKWEHYFRYIPFNIFYLYVCVCICVCLYIWACDIWHFDEKRKQWERKFQRWLIFNYPFNGLYIPNIFRKLLYKHTQRDTFNCKLTIHLNLFGRRYVYFLFLYSKGIVTAQVLIWIIISYRHITSSEILTMFIHENEHLQFSHKIRPISLLLFFFANDHTKYIFHSVISIYTLY